MSEFKIVTPEEVDAADPISADRKKIITDVVSHGLMVREEAFYFSPVECQFARDLATRAGWDASVQLCESYLDGAKLIIRRKDVGAAA